MSDRTSEQFDVETTGRRYPPSMEVSSGPVLVATDGTPAGEAAFSAGALIAARTASVVEVILVVEPLPVLVPEPSMLQPLVASPALLDAARDRVIEALRKVAPAGLDWRVDTQYGRPSAEIISKASRSNAQLIAIGLVHHGIVDRILDGDTAVEIVRESSAPVLLVSSTWETLPRRVLVAVDFSPPSMRAARACLRILADDAAIVLAHVRPTPTVFDDMERWEEQYDQMSARELDKFAKALNAPSGMRVEGVTLAGRASNVLLRHADEIQADLVVAGAHGAGLMQRLLIGSVATRLMHHSKRSLLIVPSAEEGARTGI